jgi:replicative DNA helicase
MGNAEKRQSENTTSGRTPRPSNEVRYPQNLEAERALLGSILIDNSALDRASELIGAEDFFSRAHQLIFSEMLVMSGNNQGIDFVTISESLAARGYMERVGGAAYIASLTDGVPFGAGTNVTEYCRIIREKSSARNLLNLLYSSETRVMEGIDSATEIAEEIQAGIAEIGEAGAGSMMVPVESAMRKTTEMLMTMQHGKPLLSGMPTGFRHLDDMTGGFQAGDMVVIAARTSGGKTALALDLISNFCKRKEPAALLSLEMTKESVLLRLLCKEAEVSLHKLRTGFTSKKENQRLIKAIGVVSAWPLWIADPASMSADAMVCKLMAMAKTKGIKLAAVDYLQLLHAKAENRTQEVSYISRQLKHAAHEIGKISGGSVIAVSQLSRVKPDEELELYHLRESGQIENDSDVVFFIYNEKRSTSGTFDEQWIPKFVKIAKQRNGLTGRIRMGFVPHLMTFRESARVSEEPEDIKMAAAGDES